MSDNIEIVVDVKGIKEVTEMGNAFARMTEAFNSLSKIEAPLKSLQNEIGKTAEIAKTLEKFKASDSSIGSFKAMTESIKELGRVSAESSSGVNLLLANLGLKFDRLASTVSQQVEKIDELIASMGQGASKAVLANLNDLNNNVVTRMNTLQSAVNRSSNLIRADLAQMVDSKGPIGNIGVMVASIRTSLETLATETKASMLEIKATLDSTVTTPKLVAELQAVTIGVKAELDLIKAAITTNAAAISSIPAPTTPAAKLAADLKKTNGSLRANLGAVKQEVTGYYDSMGTFVSNASVEFAAQAAAAEKAAWDSALGMGANTVAKYTPQAKVALAGHYDSMGMFVSTASAEFAAKAGAADKAAWDSAFAMGANTITKHIPIAQRAIAGYYDSLGMFIAAKAVKTAAEIAASNALISKAMAFAPSMTNAVNSAQGAYQQYDPATGAQGAVVYASAQTEAQARIYDAARDAEYAKTVAHLNAKNDLYLANQAKQGKIFDAARDAEYAKAQANLTSQAALYDAHKDKVYATKLAQGKLFDAARDAEYAKTQANLIAQAALYDAHKDKVYAGVLAQGKLFDAARDAEYLKVQTNLKAQALLYDTARDARFAKDVAAMQRILGMGGLLTGLTGAGGQLTGVMQGLARGFQMVTTTGTHLLAMLAGFGAAAASMKALHVGSEVAENLADIQHLAGASREEITTLGTAISSLAQSSSYGPVAAAKALQVLALAGLNATDSLIALRPTLNFSITGGMDIEKSAESLVAITTAYGYSASGIGTVADVIAKAAAVSMASVDAMTNSFRVASVVAQQYGVTLEDSAMSLMFLSQIGIKGTAAGTAMTNFYTQMMAGTGPAMKAMKQLGLTMVDTTTNSAKPLVQIVTELDVALRKYTYTEQLAYIQKITTNRGSKELAALLVAYRNNLKETNPEIEAHIAGLRKAGKEEEALRAEKELSMTTFKKYQEALKDSAGFNDIAAAGKSYTPHQQGESIKASFTGDLNDAFTKSADAVYLLGDAILQVFRSDEFRQMIDTMVSGVTSFVAALVDGFAWIVKNKDAIADWITTAATWAVAIGAGILVVTGLVGAISLVGTAIEAYELIVASATLRTGVFATALEAMNLAIFATPVGWAILAAGAITAGTAYLLLRDNTTEAEKSAKTYAEAQKKAIEADALRAGVMEGSIAKSIQNYKDIDAARARGISLEELKQEREIEFMQNAITREEELAVASVELENTKMQARMETLKSYGITSGIEYDQLTKSINKTLEQIGTIRLLAQAHRDSNAAMVQELKDRAAAQAEYEKTHRKIPPSGNETGPEKVDTKGIKAKENALQALNDAMTKFGKTTDDMEKSLKKVTASETFLIDTEILLEKAVRTGALTAQGKIEVLKILKQMAGERDLAVEANEVHKVTTAAAALNAKLTEQINTRHKQTEAEALLAKLRELEKGTLTDVTKLEIENTKAALDSAKAKEHLLVLMHAYDEASKNAMKVSAETVAHLKAMDSVAASEAAMEVARGAAMQRGPEFLAQLEAETAYREKQAGAISNVEKTIESLTKTQSDLDLEGMALSPEQLEDNDKALIKLKEDLVALIAKTKELGAAAGNNALRKWLTIDRDRIAGDLAKAIMTGFDQGGQQAIRNLRDALTREFLLKPIEIMIKGTITDIIGGAFGGGDDGGLNGGSTAGSLISTGSSLYSMYTSGTKAFNAISGWISGGSTAGTGVASALGNLSASAVMTNSIASTTATTAAANTAIGSGASTIGMVDTAGSVIVSSSAPTVLTTTGATLNGSVMSGAMGTSSVAAAPVAEGVAAAGGESILAAIPGWGWAALAVIAAFAIFGGDKKSVKSLGESTGNFDANGTLISGQDATDRFGVDSRSANAVTSNLERTYLDTAVSLGIKAGAATFAFGSNDSEGGKFALGGGSNGKYYASGEVNSSEAAIKLSASRAVAMALSGSELPQYLEGMFDNIDISTIGQEDLDKLMGLGFAVKSFHDMVSSVVTNNLTDASYATVTALGAASGGMDKLAANVATYYEKFYTASERTSRGLTPMQQEFEKLGKTMPKTSEEFRNLVEAQDLTTDAGIATAAALYRLAPGFASLQEGIAKSTAALVGFDGAGLSKMMLDAAFNPQAGMSAAESFGVALEASVRNTLITSTVGGIANSIFQSIVVPMVAGAAVSQSAMNAVMVDAQSKLSALKILFSSTAFKDAMATIKASITDILPEIPSFASTPISINTGSTSGSGSDTPEVDPNIQATKDLTLELNKAMSGGIALRQLEIAQRKIGMNIDNRNLIDRIAEQELLKTNISWQEKIDVLQGKTTERKLALEHDLANAGDASTQALIRLTYSLEDVQSTIDDMIKTQQENLDKAKAATDKAFSRLETLVNKQREVVNETITSLKSILATLDSGIKSLYASVAPMVEMQALQGQAFIDNALSNARITGYMPDPEDFGAAVSDAIAGVNAQAYASQADADFAKLALAGKLTAFSDLARPQLSTAEKALKDLDDILIKAQEQIDAVRGVDSSVQTVAQAVAALANALSKEATAAVKATNITGTGGAVYNVAAGTGRTASGAAFNGPEWLAAAQAGYNAGTYTLQNIYDTVAASGFHGSEDIAKILGVQASDVDAFTAALGLPQLAVGTNYVPQDMIAMLHKGEAVLPKAYNPTAGGERSSGNSNNERLEALVETLTAEVKRLQFIVNDGNTHARRTADTLENVTEYGTNMRTVPA